MAAYDRFELLPGDRYRWDFWASAQIQGTCLQLMGKVSGDQILDCKWRMDPIHQDWVNLCQSTCQALIGQSFEDVFRSTDPPDLPNPILALCSWPTRISPQ